MEIRHISLSVQSERVNLLTKTFEGINRLVVLIKEVFNRIKTLAVLFMKEGRRSILSTSESGERVTLNNREDRPQLKKLLKYIIWGIIIFSLLYFVAKAIKGISINPSQETSKLAITPAKASQDINKEFTFPLKNSKGEEVSRIKFTLEKAELRDEIIVKGKPARAVKGRIFLILTIKVTNNYSQPVEINTRDYLRLSVNKNENEWFAPDTHNDPVEVQAISTEPAILGFAINETDRDLVLKVGEINQGKETIELNLANDK